MKIGLIIPSTSNNRDWTRIDDAYLYKDTLKSFKNTYDNQHHYTFYIGIDRNDRIYDNHKNQLKLTQLCTTMKSVNIEYIYMDNVNKGHLTIMWNILFKKAYDDVCRKVGLIIVLIHYTVPQILD
jgi:hypothetical protein